MTGCLPRNDLFSILNQGEDHPWWAERMRAIRQLTQRPLRRIRIPRETGCYGREAELDRLQALFLAARSGEGQVVLIEGEAGIGKTRLVDEFVGNLQRSGEDVNFLFGAYPPGGAATGAGAFSTAYREHFGEEDLESSLAGYLKVTPLLIPAFAALLRGDQIPKGVEPLTRDSLQAVFVHASRALAEERPTVILIDDLHFAPDEGRALFAALAMAVTDHRLLVVGTARRGTVGEWMGTLDRLPHVSRLALTRLHREDMDRLLGEAFRSPALVRELGEEVAHKSDGNPFFLFEILRGLRESRLIKQRADGAWIKTQSIRQLQIPSSVRELVQARLHGLEEEDRDLLEMACCWGFEFDPGLVADALERGAVPVLKQCGRLEHRTQLIRAAGRNYVFDHHQVQETLYESIFPQLRESYHAALATALAARERAPDRDPAELDGAVAVGLCKHFMKGARPADALRYLLPALDHLERGYLNGAAVELADTALAVPGLIAGGARIDLLLRRAERLDLLGRREDAGTTLAEAAERLTETDSDPILKARVSCRYGGHLIQTARYEEAQAALAAAIEVAQAAGDAHEEAAATGNLGVAMRALGRFEEAQALQERSLELAKSVADRRREAIAHGNLGLVFLDRGVFDAARTHFERNLELAQEIGHRQGEAIATGNLGMLDGSLGRFEAARVHLEHYLALARQIGYRQGEAIAAGNLGNALFELGRYADALELEELFVALARDIGFRRGETIGLSDLGLTWAALGETHKARELLSAALGALARDRCSQPPCRSRERARQSRGANRGLRGGDPALREGARGPQGARRERRDRRHARRLWRAPRESGTSGRGAGAAPRMPGDRARRRELDGAGVRRRPARAPGRRRGPGGPSRGLGRVRGSRTASRPGRSDERALSPMASDRGSRPSGRGVSIAPRAARSHAARLPRLPHAPGAAEPRHPERVALPWRPADPGRGTRRNPRAATGPGASPMTWEKPAPSLPSPPSPSRDKCDRPAPGLRWPVVDPQRVRAVHAAPFSRRASCSCPSTSPSSSPMPGNCRGRPSTS